MALKLVTYSPGSCVRCGGADGPELGDGDIVQIFLDQERHPDFPASLTGVVTAVMQASVSDTTRSYSVQYETDDLGGSAATEISSCDITSLVCASGYDLLQEQIDDLSAMATNVLLYGASPSNADNLDAINLAIAATPLGGRLYFPPGRYLVSDTINLGNGRGVQGAGSSMTHTTEISPSASFPAGHPLFLSIGNNTSIRNIYSAMAGRGGNWFTTSGQSSFNQVEWNTVQGVATGYFWIELNDTAGISGVALTCIEHNFVHTMLGGSGIWGNGGGDSCRIAHNTFSLGASAEYIILWNGKSGAACLTFDDNNCTGGTKFIKFTTATQFKITNCQLEATVTLTSALRAMIEIVGSANGGTIANCNINCHTDIPGVGALRGIYLNAVTFCLIENCTISGDGSTTYLHVTTSATNIIHVAGAYSGVLQDDNASSVVTVIDPRGQSIFPRPVALNGGFTGTDGLLTGRLGFSQTTSGDFFLYTRFGANSHIHNTVRSNFSVSAAANSLDFWLSQGLPSPPAGGVISGGAIAAAGNVYTKVAHGLITGDSFVLTSLTGGTPLVATTIYYFYKLTADTGYFCSNPAAAAGGIPIDVTVDATAVVITPYAYPQILAASFKGDGNVNFPGVVTANTFTGIHTGNGAGLTSLDGANIATGNIAAARINNALRAPGAIGADTAGVGLFTTLQGTNCGFSNMVLMVSPDISLVPTGESIRHRFFGLSTIYHSTNCIYGSGVPLANIYEIAVCTGTANTTVACMQWLGDGSTKALGPVQAKGYTVAGLAALTAREGMRVYVTDASAPTFLSTLTGGGAVKCPAFYNGAAWVAG